MRDSVATWQILGIKEIKLEWNDSGVSLHQRSSKVFHITDAFLYIRENLSDAYLCLFLI